MTSRRPDFDQAKPTSKQLNPEGLGDTDGIESSGCPTPSDISFFLGIGIIYSLDRR